MSKPHWTAEENSLWKTPEDGSPLCATSGFVLRYNPTPEPIKNDDGSISLSMSFPALAVTAFVAFPKKIAEQIARDLNTHKQLLEALKLSERCLVAVHGEPDGSSLGSKAGAEAIRIIRDVIAAAEAPAQTRSDACGFDEETIAHEMRRLACSRVQAITSLNNSSED